MPEKHNITIIGPTKSGKTQIVNRLAGKPFVDVYRVRLGLNPVRKNYKDPDIQIEYLDVGLNIQSEQINNALVRSSKICLVFDAADPQWMQALDGYLTSKNIVIPVGTQLLILGNKVDLLTKEQQSAVEASAKAYAQRKDAQFLLVSAKMDFNIPTDSLTTNLPRLSLDAIPKKRQSFSQGSSYSSTSNLLAAKLKQGHGGLTINDLFISSDEEEEIHSEGNGSDSGRLPLNIVSTAPRKKVDARFTTPLKAGVNPREFGASPLRYTPTRLNVSGSTPPTDTTLSFALRLAGMALILAAITSLIYLAIVAAGFLSSVAVIGMVNHVMVTVGGLLGMTAPAAALTQFFAAYGISTAVGSELLATSASLLTLGVGYGLRRLGQKPAAANDELDPSAASQSTLSYALRLVGMALLVAAVANLVYLLLVAINVLPAAALMAGTNYLLVTVGGVLGFSAPVAAFTNACAAIGLSTTTAAGVLSAASSVVMAGIGYSLFGRNRPVRFDQTDPTSDHEHESGRATPPLEMRPYGK